MCNHVCKCLSVCVCVCAGTLRVGGSCVWLRECVYVRVCGDLHTGTAVTRHRMFAGSPLASRLHAYQGGSRCSRSNRTSASLSTRSLSLSFSLPRASAHTHYRSCAQPAGPALSFALCSRHCWDKRGTEVREERGALAAKVCVSGFILVLFLSAPIVCMSKCVCVCVDSKSLNGISEGLSGSR